MSDRIRLNATLKVFTRAESKLLCFVRLRGLVSRSCVNLVTNLNQSRAGRVRPGKQLKAIKTRAEEGDKTANHELRH